MAKAKTGGRVFFAYTKKSAESKARNYGTRFCREVSIRKATKEDQYRVPKSLRPIKYLIRIGAKKKSCKIE